MPVCFNYSPNGKVVTADEAFAARIAELGGPIEELKAKVVGATSEMIEGSREVCRAHECAMGNLVADAMLDRTKDQGVVFAIQNGGGLRASIDAGEVTMGEVLTVLPFQNTLATFSVQGSDVIAALEYIVTEKRRDPTQPTVANLSLGTPHVAELFNQAVELAVASNITVVVAAGNDSMDACATSPASALPTIAVGALRRDG